jgi:hypothetical protein
LEALRVNGVVAGACRAAKVSKQAAYQYRGRHPDFAQRWDDAAAEAVGRAEAELYRRGVEG